MKANNMMREMLVAATLMAVAACGTVEAPEATDDQVIGGDEGGDTGSGSDSGSDSDSDTGSGSGSGSDSEPEPQPEPEPEPEDPPPPPKPPIEVSDFEKGELFDWSFAADSPISRTYNPGKTGVVYQRVIQNTTDPVAFSWSGTRGKIRVTAATATDIISVAGNDFQCAGSSDPLCTSNGNLPVDPDDDPAATVDSNAALFAVLVDEETGTVLQTGSGLTMSGVLPARASNAAPRTFRIVVMMGAVVELSTTPGMYGFFPEYSEQTFMGQHYVGYKPHNISSKCFQWSGTMCSTYVRYWHIEGLDRAKLSFEPISWTLSINGEPPTSYTTGALVWDAGDEDLPGPQH